MLDTVTLRAATSMDTGNQYSAPIVSAIIAAVVTGFIAVFGFMARWIFGKAIIERIDRLEEDQGLKQKELLVELRALVTKQGEHDRALAIGQKEFEHMREELRRHGKEIQRIDDQTSKVIRAIQLRKADS